MLCDILTLQEKESCLRIEQGISDHNPIISPDKRMISWNTWAPLIRNGFQTSEEITRDREDNKNPNESKIPLQIEQKVDCLINMLTQTPDVEIIALQEIPGDFRNRRSTFLSLLESKLRDNDLEHFIAKGYAQLDRTGEGHFGQLTLFDTRKYRLISSEGIESSRILASQLHHLQDNPNHHHQMPT